MERAERIKQAIAKKSELIEMKKAAVKTADSVIHTPSTQKTEANKADAPKGNQMMKTIVLNTYNWMDSHDDVHLEGIFTKTISERGPKGSNNIFHLADHEYKISAKVGQPKDIYEKQMAWTDLGVNKEGYTTALIMESEIKREWNERMYNAYKDGEINQHSVGMQYVKIDLAADDPENKEAQDLYKEVLPKLGNREKAEEQGYFFVVREARLKEGSAVLLGSNTITPTIKDEEPSKDTPKDEPLENTQKDEVQDLIKMFNNQF